MVDCVHVLKLGMVNLQIGHLRFLHELESPFVTGEETTTEDLLLAVLVCSLDHASARKHIGRWYMRPIVKLWGWRCAKSCNLIYEGGKFRKYLSDSMAARKVKKANGGKSLYSPLHQRLYLMLVEDLGHNPCEVWDFPVREAIDLWMARAEKAGALEFWSDRELTHWEIHQQRETEWRASQEARVE